MSQKRNLVLVAHNIRSAHNVGSLMRTADGLGITGLFLTGYTPHPPTPDDERLPHIQQKITKQIQKTALGAESTINWQYSKDIIQPLGALRKNGYLIVGLEQDSRSKPLPGYEAPHKVAVIIGREVEGLEQSVRDLCDLILEIPMAGKKESFNVAQATAMALYQLTYY